MGIGINTHKTQMHEFSFLKKQSSVTVWSSVQDKIISRLLDWVYAMPMNRRGPTKRRMLLFCQWLKNIKRVNFVILWISHDANGDLRLNTIPTFKKEKMEMVTSNSYISKTNTSWNNSANTDLLMSYCLQQYYMAVLAGENGEASQDRITGT